MPHTLPDHKTATVGDIRELLRASASFRKNGESWREYWFTKWITPQNICVLVMAAVTIGGRVQRIEGGVDDATKVAARAAEVAAKAAESQAQLLQEIGRLSRTVDAQQSLIEKQRELYATKDDVTSVRERVRLSVTRNEFQEAIFRGVVPRLDRIEKSVKMP